ncbi:chromosomal replication initiator protein DnaA [bacterium]|nr:chromosomal replication initiator protein DnaA [candidate division CSSED10-310 bacterium]
MKQTSEDLWLLVLRQVKKRVSRQVFETWFKNTSQLSLGPDILIVEVPSALYSQFFNEKYSILIQEIVEELAQKRMEIRYQIAQTTDQSYGPLFESGFTGVGLEKSESDNISVELELHKQGMQSHYSFERFVVGPSNQFAHAAALAVASNPSKSYNPFYIYGGVGLGKTHLMHAIGNKIHKNNPKANILYVQSEQFTNDVIVHIRLDRMQEFRKKYRNVDVLLIDDIQFIAGKDSTVTEFFHTFNTLHNARKQIVISSDQPPRNISNLEERIRSRFEWGLIADIQPPSLETKVAILQKKAEELDMALSNDIALFMASKITSNIRELEGSLLNLAARVSLTGSKVNMEAASEALKQYVSENDRVVTIDMVQKQVAQFYDIKTSSLRAKGRSQDVAIPRQVSMYLSRELTQQSLVEIGKKFGGRNHTTVIHACKKIESEMLRNSELKNQVNLLKGILQG